MSKGIDQITASAWVSPVISSDAPKQIEKPPSSNSPSLIVPHDEEGDFYKRLLKAKKENFAEEQALWLEKLSDLYLHKRDFVKAALLLNGACALSSSKEPLLKKMGKIESAFLESKGIRPSQQSFSRITNGREYLQRVRTDCKEKFDQIDPFILASVKPTTLSDAFRSLPSFLTVQYRSLLKIILTDAIDVIGPPPTEWACFGMGSMAREEMSPYSDLEFAFLIRQKNEEILSYFRTLTQFMQLMIINLGETKFPVFGDQESSPTPSGFCLDTGGNTPLGVTGAYELIGRLEELAEFVDSAWVQRRGIILPNAMSTVCYIAGDQQLVEQYENAKERVLDRSNPKGTNREILAFELLSGHLKEFKPNLSFEKEQEGAFGVKKELYRPFQEILGCLALHYRLKEKRSFKRILELEKMGVFSEDGTRALGDRLADVFYMRIKAHLFYKNEEEYFLLSQIGKPQEGRFLYIDYHDQERLEFIYATLMEFHHCAEVFFQTKKAAAFSQSMMQRELVTNVAHKKQKLPKNLVPSGRAYGESAYVLPQGIDPREMEATRVAHKDEMEGYQQSLALNPIDWLSAMRLGELEEKDEKYDDALFHYLKASAMVREMTPHAATLSHRIGKIYRRRGKFEEARPYLQNAVLVQTVLYQHFKEHPLTGTVNVESDYFNLPHDLVFMFHDLAEVESHFQNSNTAIDLFHGLLTLIPIITPLSLHTPVHADQLKDLEINTLLSLGKEYYTVKNFSESQYFYKRGLVECQMREKIPAHSERYWAEIFLALKWLATIAENQGKFAKATKLYQSAILEVKKHYTNLKKYKTHQETCKELQRIRPTLYLDLSDVCYLNDDYENALKCAQYTLKFQIELYGADDFKLARTHQQIGRVLLERGELGVALRNFQTALTLAEKHYEKKKHPELSFYHNYICYTYLQLGHFDLALQFGNLSFDEIQQGPSPIDSAIGYQLSLLGRVLLKMGRVEESISNLEKALALGTQDKADLMRLHRHLAEAYALANLPEKGLEKILEALEFHRTFYGDQHSSVARDLLVQAKCFLKSGNLEKASSSASKALDIFKRVYGAKHESVRETQEILGKASKATK